MNYEVKVSLKQGLVNPMLCIVCGSNTNVYPRGIYRVGYTYQFYTDYKGHFYFPVCELCVFHRAKLNEKKKRNRTPEENNFIKLYDDVAVQIRIYYRPLLGLKEAKIFFYRQDYAEAFARLNHGELI